MRRLLKLPSRSQPFLVASTLAGFLIMFGQPLDAMSPTAIDSEIINKKTETAIDAGLDFLSKKQNKNGSFGSGANADNVGVVSLIGIAFMSQGSLPGKGKYGAELNRIVRFILDHCQENGFITNPMSQTHGPMYGHGFATLFLAEAYGAYPEPELRERLAKATQLIIDTQNAEGGWRYQPTRSDADLSVTICQVMALRAAKNAGIYVPNSTIKRCVEYVKKSQNPDGGFRYILKPGSSAFQELRPELWHFTVQESTRETKSAKAWSI